MGRTLKVAIVATTVYAINAAVAAAAGGVFNPGGPQAPPGSGKLKMVGSWIEWGGYGACVIGIILVAITLALEHRHGGGGGMGGGAGGGVIRVLIAVIMIGAASGIVGTLSS